MSLILLSRLSDTPGKAIAHQLAEKLGYECLDEEVVEQTASEADLSADLVRRALSEPPSLLGMRSAVRRRCLVRFRATLATRLLQDKVVYHGPFGGWVIRGVSHALTVRIHADAADRAAARSRKTGLDLAQARKIIQREDRGRLALVRELFEGDDDDVGRFDLVVNTSQVDPESAVDLIAETAGMRRYQPNSYSQRCLQDLSLAHQVEARLVDLDPKVAVEVDGGHARIRTQLNGAAAKRRFAEIERRALDLQGIRAVQIQNVGDLFSAIAGRLR